MVIVYILHIHSTQYMQASSKRAVLVLAVAGEQALKLCRARFLVWKIRVTNWMDCWRGPPPQCLSAIAQEIPRKSGNNSVASKEFSRILGRRRPLLAGSPL